jgi:hypothetical protein
MTVINNKIYVKYTNKNEINLINKKLNVVIGIMIFIFVIHIARTD